MRDAILLTPGAIAGVIAAELYSPLKARFLALRSRRDLRSSTTRDDPRNHAANVVEIFREKGFAGNLYETTSTTAGRTLPILADVSERFVGPLAADSDWPLEVSAAPRSELAVNDRVIGEAARHGVELWDGTVLYATGWNASAARLEAARCNYYSYVSFGEQVLRESDSVRGGKPYLELTHHFDQAIHSSRGPTAIAAATTCVFESAEGHRTAVHQRPSSVVNARGMYAVTPVNGIEPNSSGTERSRYGVVVYNVLKEVLEEFFGIAEINRNSDQPYASHPDLIFATPIGEQLVAELDAGRLKLFCDGACIDLTDGSLIMAVSAHFLDDGLF